MHQMYLELWGLPQQFSWTAPHVSSDVLEFVQNILKEVSGTLLEKLDLDKTYLYNEYTRYWLNLINKKNNTFQNKEQNQRLTVQPASSVLFILFHILWKTEEESNFKNLAFWLEKFYSRIDFNQLSTLFEFYKLNYKQFDTIKLWNLICDPFRNYSFLKKVVYDRKDTPKYLKSYFEGWVLEGKNETYLEHINNSFFYHDPLKVNYELFRYLFTIEDNLDQYYTQKCLEILATFNQKQVTSLPSDFLDYIKINLNGSDEEFKKNIAQQQGQLSPTQSKVLSRINENNVYFLTGGAGSGKSQVISQLYKYFSSNGQNTIILSPTGKAVQNLTQRLIKVTDEKLEKITKKVRTFHSYFSWFDFKPKALVKKPRSEFEDIDVLIFEESSMISSEMLFYTLSNLNLLNIKKIIFVGDPNQLPPVTESQLFYALLASCHSGNIKRLFEMGQLSTNLRVKDGADLVNFQHKALSKSRARLQLPTNRAFLEDEFLEYNENSIFDEVPYIQSVKEVQKDLPDKYRIILNQLVAREYSAISNESYKDGGNNYSIISYTNSINDKINKYLNRYLLEQGITSSSKIIQRNYKGNIYLYEKLIMTRNLNVANNMFVNGDVVYLLDFKVQNSHYGENIYNEKDSNVSFLYIRLLHRGQEIELNHRDLENLEENLISYFAYGYSTTIHKSQGGEYNHVYHFINDKLEYVKYNKTDEKHLKTINPPYPYQFSTNTMESFYTAISRAQRKCWIFLSDNLLKGEKSVSQYTFYLHLTSKKQSSLNKLRGPVWNPILVSAFLKNDYFDTWKLYYEKQMEFSKDILTKRYELREQSPEIFNNVVNEYLYGLWIKIREA